MKAIYIAGRVSWGDDVLPEFAKELEQRDHHITCKWWKLGRLPKPYLDNLDSSQKAAKLMVEAVMESDVLILFAEDNVLGAATELGVAIGDTSRSRVNIVVVPEGVRQSVFYAHPEVVAVSDIDKIRSMDWY